MELTASGGPSFFIRTDYLVSVAPEKLCCGAFFSDEETEDIVQAGFAFAAERQALSFLNRSEHSRFMLELKLAKKGHAKDASAKAQDKMYYHHSGYVGGMKARNFEKTIERHPEEPLMTAIKGMLPKGPLGRRMLTNVKVYAGAEHPHAAQHPLNLEI